MKFSFVNLPWGVKALLLVVFIAITIITCAGVWNYCPELFVKAVAVLLLLSNGCIAVWVGKHMEPKSNKDEKKENQ